MGKRVPQNFIQLLQIVNQLVISKKKKKRTTTKSKNKPMVSKVLSFGFVAKRNGTGRNNISKTCDTLFPITSKTYKPNLNRE